MLDAEERPRTRVLAAEDGCALVQAVTTLKGGGLVVFPTDTVYGLGCDLWQPEAVERLYWAKMRPGHLAIPVLVAGADFIPQVAQDLPPVFQAVVDRFWPGALTLIVPSRPAVPEVLRAGQDSVAVRMPAHPLALRLISEVGGAIAATSANLSGGPSPQNAADALHDLAGRVDLVLDGGRCSGGVASSIVDLVSQPPRLLRRGALALSALRKVLPDLVIPDAD